MSRYHHANDSDHPVAGERLPMSENKPPQLGVHRIVMPLRVWRKMTPEEYAEQYSTIGKHVSVSQEIVAGCQEVWVYLGGFVQFQ